MDTFLEDDDAYQNHPIDKQRVPPIHQKRLLAFVNDFIVQTVGFLNGLIVDVDHKFLRCETKMRKLEDSLAILESKLSSIPSLRANATSESIIEKPPEEVKDSSDSTRDMPSSSSAVPSQVETVQESQPSDVIESEVPAESSPASVKASEDYRYKKYFKMIHYGAHPQAIKNKVASEGLDPNILDDPNQILADGQRTPPPASDSSDDSS